MKSKKQSKKPTKISLDKTKQYDVVTLRKKADEMLRQANQTQNMDYYNEAIILYDELMNKSKDDCEIFKNKGKCYQGMKIWNKAFMEFQNALNEEIRPDFHFEAGVCKQNDGLWSEAEQQFT